MTSFKLPAAATIGALLSFCILSGASATPAPRCDVTVTGSGSDPIDAAAVSLAINGPHSAANVTVCLQGLFDFGTTSFVAIDPLGPVEELNVTGLDGATIVGGIQPLRFMQTSTLPRLSIKNLRFVSPFETAISIFRGNERIEISGVAIDGVQSLFVPGFGLAIREGVAVTAAFAEIAGDVEITNNTIDGGVYDNVTDLQVVNAGIGLFGGFALNANPISASVRVARNDLRNWAGSAIAAIGLSGATIDNNSIAPGSFANKILSGACAMPTGLGSATAISLTGTVNSLIKSNTIELAPAFDGEGSPACNAGIVLLGNAGASTSDSTGNEFKGNQVVGTGSYGFVVGLDTSAAEEGNWYHDNNLSTLAATRASLFLGTGANGNTLKGNFPTVEGNVAGNSITGQK